MRADPATRPRKERRIAATYKHKEENHLRLKRLSQLLDRTMGDILDEALEKHFPELIQGIPSQLEI